MSGFGDATGWLQSSVNEFAGELVDIRRGSDTTEGVTAVRGSTNPKLTSQDGRAYIELRGTEWLVKPSDYTFGGSSAQPLPGDRLVAGDETFVATPFVTGEPCWRYTDPSKTYYRIHMELEP